MGLSKIDGIRIKEEDCKINLKIREEDKWGVQIDVHLTPLYCLNCNNQLDGFFHHNGSRYGQVGSTICNHCGSEIFCTDSDNIVEYLNMYTQVKGTTFDNTKKSILDYYKLYKLDKQNWIALKSKAGYDIFKRHKDECIPLDCVITEVCDENNIKLRYVQQEIPVIDERIKRLPDIVNKWIVLLHNCGIDI